MKTPLCDTTKDACKNLMANASGDYVVVTTSTADTLGTLYTLDQSGNIVAQMPDSGAEYSWTGQWYLTNSNRIASAASESNIRWDASEQAAESSAISILQSTSVSAAYLPPIVASSLWAFQGGDPSHNGVAARPWYFTLAWENDFTLQPNFPKMTSDVVDISAQAPLIKTAALQALTDAYSGVKDASGIRYVVVHEGKANTGDVTVRVVNHQTLCNNKPSYGCSVDNSHQVDYSLNMLMAQKYYNVRIESHDQLMWAAKNRTDYLAAMGRAIGNVAAHEVAHGFLRLCCGMDADPNVDLNARGTFNNGSSDGDVQFDPTFWTGYWPEPRITLHWEPSAEKALGQCLGSGWRDFHARSCHN